MEQQTCDKPEEIDKAIAALSVISGKWKLTILTYLRFGGTHRFNELQRTIPGITRKMLTVQLRELEQHGLVVRQVYAQVPPKVEYSLSEYGQTLVPLLDVLHDWGEQHTARQLATQPAESTR